MVCSQLRFVMDLKDNIVRFFTRTLAPSMFFFEQARVLASKTGKNWTWETRTSPYFNMWIIPDEFHTSVLELDMRTVVTSCCGTCMERTAYSIRASVRVKNSFPKIRWQCFRIRTLGASCHQWRHHSGRRGQAVRLDQLVEVVRLDLCRRSETWMCLFMLFCERCFDLCVSICTNRS